MRAAPALVAMLMAVSLASPALAGVDNHQYRTSWQVGYNDSFGIEKLYWDHVTDHVQVIYIWTYEWDTWNFRPFEAYWSWDVCTLDEAGNINTTHYSGDSSTSEAGAAKAIIAPYNGWIENITIQGGEMYPWPGYFTDYNLSIGAMFNERRHYRLEYRASEGADAFLASHEGPETSPTVFYGDRFQLDSVLENDTYPFTAGERADYYAWANAMGDRIDDLADRIDGLQATATNATALSWLTMAEVDKMVADGYRTTGLELARLGHLAIANNSKALWLAYEAAAYHYAGAMAMEAHQGTGEPEDLAHALAWQEYAVELAFLTYEEAAPDLGGALEEPAAGWLASYWHYLAGFASAAILILAIAARNGYLALIGLCLGVAAWLGFSGAF